MSPLSRGFSTSSALGSPTALSSRKVARREARTVPELMAHRLLLISVPTMFEGAVATRRAFADHARSRGAKISWTREKVPR
jgi:hypothetical protein